MLVINPQTVDACAESAHFPYTTYTDLTQKPEVYELIAEEVMRANADLAEAIRVRRFVLLHKRLDPDDDEITRTRKVRRGVIADRYRVIVDALDSDAEQVTVSSVVTYQDGSKVERPIPLRLMSMEGFTPAPSKNRRLAGVRGGEPRLARSAR